MPLETLARGVNGEKIITYSYARTRQNPSCLGEFRARRDQCIMRTSVFVRGLSGTGSRRIGISGLNLR